MGPSEPIASVSEIPPGTAKVVEIGDMEVAVFNVDGHFYALNNECPHELGPLGEGKIRGDIVMCPWHMWAFNIKTGVAVSYPDQVAKCYNIRIEGDQIYVELDDDETN